MSRKTKKQKIIAAYRQKLKQIKITTPPPTLDKTTIVNLTLPQKTISENFIYRETDEDVGFKKWVMKELGKTFIITSFIITLEFIIFYAKLKGVLKF